MDLLGARWLDPDLGRFISPDSIVPTSNALTVNALDAVSAQAFFAASKSTGPISPQHLNRYSYANNDPLTHTDPNGHIPATCFYCTWPNFIWQWGTQLLGLESEVDIYDMPFSAQVGANLLCMIAPCKIENGYMKAQTYGDIRMATVAMIGIVGLSMPLCPGCGLQGVSLPELGTLSNVEAREWYLGMEAQIPERLDITLPLEQQARQAFDMRNQIRTWARDLMADRATAEKLAVTDPNLTWDQIIKKAIDKGYSGDDIWRYILGSSTRSRPSVNDALGVGK